MVDRVFLHIGQPKTGTTYLQGILWSNRDRLAGDGVLLPGAGHREHLWAALDVQERKDLARRHPSAPGSWERLCSQLDRTRRGDGLITHEFFCGATADQARRAVQRLAPAEVHLIVTARDAAGMLAAGWQELVKNGGRLDLRTAASEDRHGEFSWQTWDLGGVLERWGPTVPPERVHVLPVPGPDAPPDQHWQNFAAVLGLSGAFPMPESATNQSLGAVQVQLLRRVNAHLGDFNTSLDRGQWIRGYLAEGHLVGQAGDRFAIDPDLLDDCRRRSARAVAVITERNYPVTGDVRSLLVPDDQPPRRELASVTPDEMLESAARVIAEMLSDVRRLTNEHRGATTPGAAGLSRLRAALRRLVPARGAG